MSALSTLLAKIDSWDTQPISKPVPKDTAQDLYPSAHEEDAHIVSVIKPDLMHGPWIAGGAALAWYQGNAVRENDIDIFCASSEQMQEVASRLNNTATLFERYDSKYAKTYDAKIDKQEWMVQLIKCRYFNSAQEIIDAFDISVCEIVTDGKRFVLGQHTAYDIRNNLLRFKDDLREDAIKRYAKYYAYGYKPVPGTFEKIVNNPYGKKSFAADEDYHNVF